MKSCVFQTIRDASLKKSCSIFIESWDEHGRFWRKRKAQGLCVHPGKYTHTHTHTHTHRCTASQQVHRLIRVFPSCLERICGMSPSLTSTTQGSNTITYTHTHTHTRTSAAAQANVSSEQCVLSFPQGRLLAGWWMCCSFRVSSLC